MSTQTIEEALTAAETALAEGKSLRGTGFWPAVAMVKQQPELVDRYAERVAEIDQKAFQAWAFLTVPIIPGTLLAIVATAGGLVAIAYAYSLSGWVAIIAFYAGLGVLLVTTHGLAHLTVGKVLGMRFTNWFIGTIQRPQPGVKVDYATYLRVDAAGRAWMHASGAIVTKILPLALIGAAVVADLPAWVVWSLVGLTLVTSITDVFWSTQASDWKKFKREMKFAQPS